MTKKTKENKLKLVLLYVLAAFVFAIFAAIPMAASTYVWLLYTSKTIALWHAVVISGVLAVLEGFVVAIGIGSDK